MSYVTLGAETPSKLDVLKEEVIKNITAANNIFTGFLRANVETMKLEQARPELVKWMTPVIALATKTPINDVKDVLQNVTIERTAAGGYIIRTPEKPALATQRNIFLFIRNALLFVGAGMVLTKLLRKGKTAAFGDIEGMSAGRPLYPRPFKIWLRDASGRRFSTVITAFDEDTAKHAALARVLAKFGGDTVRMGIHVEKVEKGLDKSEFKSYH